MLYQIKGFFGMALMKSITNFPFGKTKLFFVEKPRESLTQTVEKKISIKSPSQHRTEILADIQKKIATASHQNLHLLSDDDIDALSRTLDRLRVWEARILAAGVAQIQIGNEGVS